MTDRLLHKRSSSAPSPSGERCQSWEHYLQLTRNVLALLVICLLSVPVCIHAAPRDTVTIVCDWDFAPYEFIDNNRKSDGYCIEVLRDILNDLGYEHQFVMTSRQKAINDFFNHKADLIIDYGNRFTGKSFQRSLSILDYNDFVLARNCSSRPISRPEQLNGDVVAVNVINDSLPFDVVMRFEDRAELMTYTVREALGDLEHGKLAYLLWGSKMLRWKIREFNLHNVVLDTLGLPSVEIRIVGYDEALIEDIDNQYARMQQKGQIDLIADKWFYPERAALRTSPFVWYAVVGVLLLSVFIFAVYRLAQRRVRKALERNAMTEAMMRQALDMGDYNVITNNLRRNLVTNQHGHAVPEEGITMEQMMQHIHPDDREAMVMRRDVMRKLKGKPYPYHMRWNHGTEENPEWRTITGFSYPEMGHLPIPKSIVIISRDITDVLRQEKEASELTSRYIKMFESSLIAMSFYDKDGHLVNLNENMKKLCGMTEESLKFFWTTNLFDTDTFHEMDPLLKDHFHTCTHTYFPALGLDKYVEQRVRPIYDDEGKLLLFAITARDVTDERNMYLELQRQEQAIRETNQANSLYEQRLHELLENSNMYVFHANAEQRIINFSRSLHGHEFTMTFDEYINYIDEQDTSATQASIEAVLKAGKPYNVTHHFQTTPLGNTPEWFAISGMPITDADGRVKELFGVVRNVTTLMEAQQRLREETQRAENSTMLKSTFLANMTHEIRTPLNAIVGFSELLQTITDPADRKEFISIIHNNCDMLMRLINDIFEASSLDIKPLAIVPRRVDFAKEFVVVCQSLSQRVQEPAVKFIIESPMDSFVTDLDMGRIQQVITNFVTNAVKYTHKGHIRVGWRTLPQPSRPSPQQTLPQTLPVGRGVVTSTTENHEGNGNYSPPSQGGAGGGSAGSVGSAGSTGLYIYCEDTGAGIPKEKQARVFDRFVKLNDFVQGTGLGLAICKSIAQGCGGKIGLHSEGDGKGCTFWIWIPAKQRKKG